MGVRHLTKGRFVTACLKEAFRGGWVIANAATLGLVLFGSFAAWRWPELGGDMNFLMWAVPLVLLFLSLYFSSLLGAHKLYEQLAREAEQGPRLLQEQIERQEARLAELESSRAEIAQKHSLRLQLDGLLRDGIGIVQSLRQHDEQDELDRIAREIDEWIAKTTKFIDAAFPAFTNHFLSDAGFGHHGMMMGSVRRADLLNYMDRRIARLSELLNRS
jgi:hypothetical protein